VPGAAFWKWGTTHVLIRVWRCLWCAQWRGRSPSDLEPLFVCTTCGHRGGDVRSPIMKSSSPAPSPMPTRRCVAEACAKALCRI